MQRERARVAVAWEYAEADEEELQDEPSKERALEPP